MFAASPQWAQMAAQELPMAGALPKPDDRYKADILVVVAHPDDDTGVSNYLSKAALDEGKRVAVVFSTRGNSGGNTVGMEQAKALSDERDMEARRSLEARGVHNIWFLHGSDTPTQDVLHSLETVNHGDALEEVVRLVRLTRPEVVITWMPFYVAGENHGDHQASGVVATEAFDMAADPLAFPEQVNAPRAHGGIGNYGEGLHPWQAKKLYFFSDASHPEFLEGKGPKYLATDISTSRKMSFAELNKLAWDQYATQLESPLNMEHYENMPDFLVLGRSYVPGTATGDVWEGVGSAMNKPLWHVGAAATAQEQRGSLELGGPWAFYRKFWVAHDLGVLNNLTAPQTALSADHELWVPLLLHNDSDKERTYALRATMPAGWSSAVPDQRYTLQPHASFPVQLFLKAPAYSANTPPQELRWSLTEGGETRGSVALKVFMEYNGVPQ